MRLERFYDLGRAERPLCPVTGEPARWCRLDPHHDTEEAGNFVPLREDIDINRLGGATMGSLSEASLAAAYDRHLDESRAHQAYACARIALSCLPSRELAGRSLSVTLDWVRRAVHALRHSFDSEIIRQTLSDELLCRTAIEIDRPESAHRLAMELSALLSERGEHRRAEELLQVAARFVGPRDLERSAGSTGDSFNAMDFYRRRSQIWLHTKPAGCEWENDLATARLFRPDANTQFPVTEANMTAIGSFYRNANFAKAVARFDGLRAAGYLPGIDAPSDFEHSYFLNPPKLTNTSARPELLLFAGVALAAARAGSGSALAHLRVSERLFDATCGHALSPFAWRMLEEVDIRNTKFGSRLRSMGLKRIQRDGLSASAIEAITKSRDWLVERQCGESDRVIVVTEVANFNQIGGTMKFDQTTFINSNASFNEFQGNLSGDHIQEVMLILKDMRSLMSQLPSESKDKLSLQAEVASIEAEAGSGAPKKGPLVRALSHVGAILRSLPGRN